MHIAHYFWMIALVGNVYLCVVHLAQISVRMFRPVFLVGVLVLVLARRAHQTRRRRRFLRRCTLWRRFPRGRRSLRRRCHGCRRFPFGVSLCALVEVLVAAAPTFFVEEDGFASWNSCPAQPNTKAMTTTVAAIPKGCVKSPINVSGFADALDIFAFVFCRISFCWCVFFGGQAQKELEKSERELEKTRTHRASGSARARARGRATGKRKKHARC